MSNFVVALASLAKARAYVFTVVLTLGVTLGALVAMFNVNYQILAEPLPYPQADQLVMFKGERFERDELMANRSYPYPLLLEMYQQPDEAIAERAIVDYTTSIERDWPHSPVLTTANVTPEYFRIFDAPLALGRVFTLEEGLNSMQPVAVISFEAWQTHFAQDPQVLGKTLNIMGTHFKIVGVLAETFIEPELLDVGNKNEVFLPFDYNDISPDGRAGWNFNMNRSVVVSRLKAGSDRVAVEHRFSSVAAAHFKAENQGTPGFENTSLRLRLLSLTEVIRRDADRQGMLMFAGVLLLLLMAGTNVINLMLARAANQQRSMAIRVALGAQPKHMFSAVLAEVLLLMLAAGLLSLAVALGIVEILKHVVAGQLPRLHELHLSGTTMVFAAAVALLLAVIFTWLVSRQINYRSLNMMLQSSGKGAGLQISGRTRYLLILSQVALVGLLLTASLQVMWQSLREINQPLGFNIDNQYQVYFSVATLVANTTVEQRTIMMTQLQDALRTNPKIKSVGMSSGSPLRWNGPFAQMVSLDGQEQYPVLALQSFNDASFFQILDLRLVAGNFFSEQDNRTSQKVMLVNETLARRLQPDGQVVGKIIRRSVDTSSPDGIRIVGVVKDLHLPGQVEKPRFFQALITESPEFLIGVKPGQTLTSIELNSIAKTISPQLKVAFIRTAQASFEELTARQTTAAGLTASLSVLALALAAIGIYGLLSYSVKLRRFELGVRMAVGATPASIFWQVLRDNLSPIALGLFLACVVLTGLYYWVQRLSYQLDTNWLAWILPWVLILGLTAAASLMSVWQVIRHPANHVLRAD